MAGTVSRLVGFTTTGVLLTLLVVALASYLAQGPPPKMSPGLVAWRTKGTYFQFGEHRIFYRDSLGRGDHNAPALICLHGFPSFSYDWAKMWPQLVQKETFSRVIAVDFLGYGFSDKPQGYNYTIMEQADLYEALLDDLLVEEVHVLAHDYGDTVAQEMLARFNQRQAGGAKTQGYKYKILTVCLLNGGIFPETNFPLPVQKLMTVPYLSSIFARLSNQFIFTRGFGRVFGPDTQPTEQDFADFYAAGRVNDGQLVLPALLDYIAQRSYNRHRWTGALQMTSVPVHVIWGLADPVNPPGFVEFYKKTVPKGGITVLENQDIGHYPQWEDPQTVTKAYLKFIDSVGKP